MLQFTCQGKYWSSSHYSRSSYGVMANLKYRMYECLVDMAEHAMQLHHSAEQQATIENWNKKVAEEMEMVYNGVVVRVIVVVHGLD